MARHAGGKRRDAIGVFRGIKARECVSGVGDDVYRGDSGDDKVHVPFGCAMVAAVLGGNGLGMVRLMRWLELIAVRHGR